MADCKSKRRHREERKGHSANLSGHALLALAKLWSRDRYWGMWRADRLPGTWSQTEKATPTPPPFSGKNTGSLCLVRWNCCSYLQQQEKPYIHLRPQQTPKDTASVKQGSKAVITHSDLLFTELSFSASTTVYHEKLAHSPWIIQTSLFSLSLCFFHFMSFGVHYFGSPTLTNAH